MMCHGQATPRLRARSGCWESLFPGLLEQDELGNSWLLAWLPLAQQNHCYHGSCKLQAPKGEMGEAAAMQNSLQ